MNLKLSPSQQKILAGLLMAVLIWLPRGLALDRFRHGG